MYIWHTLNVLVYVLIYFSKPAHSDPNEGVETASLTPAGLNIALTKSTYFYEFHREGTIDTYTVKPEYGFSLVKIKYEEKDDRERIFWESSDSSEYSNKVELITYPHYEGMYELLIYLFNGSGIKFVRDKYAGWRQINFSVIIPINLNLTFEHNTYGYSVKCDDNSRTYYSKSGFGFDVVMEWINSETNVEIWRASVPEEYSNKVVYEFYADGRSTFQVVTIYTLDGIFAKFLNDRKTNWVPTIIDENTVLQVSIGYISECFCYKVDKKDKLVTIEAKEGFIFNGVTGWIDDHHTNDVIWESYDPDKYFEIITIDGFSALNNTGNIVIYHVNGEKTHLSLFHDTWVEVEPSLVLDISNKGINLGYVYSRESEIIESYVPTGDFLFKGVVETEGSIFSKSKEDIWFTKTNTEYANKVYLISSGQRERYLVLFLVNGGYLVFYRPDRSSPWVNQTKDKYSISELGILGIDLASLSKADDEEEQEEEDVVEEDTQSLAEFESHQKYLEWMNYIRLNPPSTFRTNDHRVSVFDSQTSPRPRPKEPPSTYDYYRVIDLEIAQISGYKGYEIECKPDRTIFRSQRPNLFKKVTHNNEVIWTYNGNGYPYKVVYKEVSGEVKIKVFFPDESLVDPRLESERGPESIPPDAEPEPIKPTRVLRKPFPTPPPKPKPKPRFDPSNIQVDVVSHRRGGHIVSE